jgi:hypothetical protein
MRCQDTDHHGSTHCTERISPETEEMSLLDPVMRLAFPISRSLTAIRTSIGFAFL